MSDESVASALRSSESLVVVESPAGCGKTYQGAAFAKNEALGGDSKRMLVLTHTHAACSVFAERTRGCSGVDIRTIDSLIGEIACAYHDALGLPADVGSWVRAEPTRRYAHLASMVASLLEANPFVARAIVARYGTLVCDEHQDSSPDQHAVVLALHTAGARVRVFADPVQSIFSERVSYAPASAEQWGDLVSRADLVDKLDTPHRWSGGCQELGQWTLDVRETLKGGGRIELNGVLPKSVRVLVAENDNRHGAIAFRPQAAKAKAINAFTRKDGTLMILTLRPPTAQKLRPLFYRRLPLWEGHTRRALDRLIVEAAAGVGDAKRLAKAAAMFLKAVGTGFGDAAFGSVLCDEASQGCRRKRRGKPGRIQELARAIVENPTHKGVAGCLVRAYELHRERVLGDTKIDCVREFWEAVALGEHDDLGEAVAAITHRRTHARSKPPAKAISTIHRAKGLEAKRVVVLPVDGDTFPNTELARNILYVALSRASVELLLVVSRCNPSPLLRL